MGQIAVEPVLTEETKKKNSAKQKSESVPFSMQVRGWDALWIAAFLTPFLLLYIGFTIYPLIATMLYSLYEWDGIGALSNYVGLENYLTIAQDSSFWLSFWNTILFALLNTIIKLPLSLLIAILLTQRWMWLKRLWRTVFFAPLVIPVALAGLVFDFLLSSRGALNDFLGLIGINSTLDFLGNPNTAMISLILISVWQIFGQYMVYWMAALQNVDDSLYEAASIDGANEWQKLIYVTLPVIRPVAVVIVFLSFVNALKVFGLIAATTQGGPGQSTYVVSYFIYNQAFRDLPFRYGYASAAAVLFGVTVLAAVTLQGYFVRKAEQ